MTPIGKHLVEVLRLDEGAGCIVHLRLYLDVCGCACGLCDAFVSRLEEEEGGGDIEVHCLFVLCFVGLLLVHGTVMYCSVNGVCCVFTIIIPVICAYKFAPSCTQHPFSVRLRCVVIFPPSAYSGEKESLIVHVLSN